MQTRILSYQDTTHDSVLINIKAASGGPWRRAFNPSFHISAMQDSLGLPLLFYLFYNVSSMMEK